MGKQDSSIKGQVIEIPLSRGHVALVDEADAARVMAFRWFFLTSGGGYAIRNVAPGSGETRLMHRFILDAAPGLQVDHIDGDGLNNTRANLRLVTNAQNAQNRRGARRGTATGVRGVEVYRRGPVRFKATLRLNGRNVCLGYFRTVEEADAAAKAGRSKYFTHSVECGAEVERG